MRIFTLQLSILSCFFYSLFTCAQSSFVLKENFNTGQKELPQVGRGSYTVEDGSLKIRDTYVIFGDTSWKNYEVKFRARSLSTTGETQIWSNFRVNNRNDRYILGLKGGLQNDLYLARLGYMGTDDHLALRHLDFKVLPNTWYTFTIQIVGNRIRVFLNDESEPRIDIEDKHATYNPGGKVALGGGWIQTEFDDLKITSLNENAFSQIPHTEYEATALDREKAKKENRRQYKEIRIRDFSLPRAEISLNGNWLFTPGYEVKDPEDAISPDKSDAGWHVIHVPDFWNPIRVWLHGERYNTASKGVSDNYFDKETKRAENYTFDYKKTDVGWYRQWIDLPQLEGKHLELHFDAVSKVSKVWVNGKVAGEHVGMFGDFNLDITKLVQPGKNLIVVEVFKNYGKSIANADEVVNVSVTVEVTQKMLKDLPHGFYGEDPAGIWQPVSLIITNPLRIKDVFIKPNLEGADFEMTFAHPEKFEFKKRYKLSTTVVDYKTGDTLTTQAIRLNGKELKNQKFNYNIAGLAPKLWSPEHPNLYNFTFTISEGKREIDTKTIRSGFKTFEVKGDYLYLNGKKYWLRGGNQTAMSIAPNDSALANKFSKLMHNGNLMVTRTHTSPYTEVWMNASDVQGVGISYEGSWPWLMIESSMPDETLIDIWKNEFYDLIKKYRNHPSLLFWTINNEMKFYDNDPDFKRTRKKMNIISDVVKYIRSIDDIHPIVFDSNYVRDEDKFGQSFFDSIDDGDIDDKHWYVNWYHGTIFKDFKGEWEERFKNPGRPLIGQEMSTGYPSETGHPVRYYTYMHQNPQSLVGRYAYEDANPKYFLEAQSFITKELAEAIRRSNPNAAGVNHFSAITWFNEVYLADQIRPQKTYYEIKKALQPILVSAELWGRHFYERNRLPTRFCVVNDESSGEALYDLTLKWKIVNNKTGTSLICGDIRIPKIDYYGREWVSPEINIPKLRENPRIDARLVLKLYQGDKILSQNEYKILLSNKSWVEIHQKQDQKVSVVSPSEEIHDFLNTANLQFEPAESIFKAVKEHPDLLIVDGNVIAETGAVKTLQQYVNNGGKLLWLNADDCGKDIFPDHIRGIIRDKGDIVMMDIPQSSVFEGIDPMDTRYFNDENNGVPYVTNGAFQIYRNSKTRGLMTYTKVHGYLNGSMKERSDYLDSIRGYPVVGVRSGKGTAILSQLMLNKSVTDPVAGKLLSNMIHKLLGI